MAADFLAGALLDFLAADLVALPALVLVALEVFLPLGAFEVALAAPGRVEVLRVVAPARPVAARAAATARRSVLPVFLTVLAMTAPLDLAHTEVTDGAGRIGPGMRRHKQARRAQGGRTLRRLAQPPSGTGPVWPCSIAEISRLASSRAESAAASRSDRSRAAVRSSSATWPRMSLSIRSASP